MGKKGKIPPVLAAWDIQNEKDHVKNLLEGKNSAVGELKPVGTVHTNPPVRVAFKKRKQN